jgi:GT2 family glycosyltransferase
MTGDVTVVISCYDRPHNLKGICQSIRSQTVKPKEIWLHYNGLGSLCPARGNLFDEVVCSTGDFKSRFATSLCVNTYYSLVCDDDCFLGNKWIENCLKTIERSPGIIGPIGSVLSESTRIKEVVETVCGKDDVKRITEVDFVSGSYFLKTEWARHLFRTKSPEHSWGCDGFQLAARAWCAEGIRCFMPPQPTADKESHGCCLYKKNNMKESKQKKLKFAGWEVGTAEEFLKGQSFIDYEIELGWKPMCLRNRMLDNNSI